MFYTIPPEQWLIESHGDVLEAKNRAREFFAQHGTYDGAEKTIEEFVRQWALKQLLDGYNYPKEWLARRR